MIDKFIISACLADGRLNRPRWALNALAGCEGSGVDMLLLGKADALPFDAVVIAAWAAPLVSKMGIVPCVTTGLGHPFHAARALSSIDFLSGALTGWNPAATHGDPPEKAADMAAAARALWDGWSADIMQFDKMSGCYLDASGVTVPGYSGPFYKVRGPVNAARPPQGHPVMVVDQAAPFALPGIDIVLASDPSTAPAAAKVLLKLTGAPDLAEIAPLFESGAIAGVHLDYASVEEVFAAAALLARHFAASRPESAGGLSLRESLGLPQAPAARLTGAPA